MISFINDPNELKGRRALVTGGSRGIGGAIVRRLLSAGARVVAVARNPVEDFPTDAALSRRCTVVSCMVSPFDLAMAPDVSPNTRSVRSNDAIFIWKERRVWHLALRLSCRDQPLGAQAVEQIKKRSGG